MLRAACLVLLTTALAACGAVPQGREPARPSTSQAGALSPTPAARMCQAKLSTAGVRFAPLPDRYYAPGCQALDAVHLDSLSGDGGAITLANLGPLACPVAQEFAGWARFGVDRAARQYLGSPLARIETMGSYSCRNVAGTARLSAHSRAEAVDIAAFVLEDGRRISVESGWYGGTKDEQVFLRVVHQSACKRFGTVLGPEYNAAHRNHIHVEGQSPKFCR